MNSNNLESVEDVYESDVSTAHLEMAIQTRPGYGVLWDGESICVCGSVYVEARACLCP